MECGPGAACLRRERCAVSQGTVAERDSGGFASGYLRIPTSTRGPWNWNHSEIGLEIRKNTPASWGVHTG